jgi:hypothetical protein
MGCIFVGWTGNFDGIGCVRDVEALIGREWSDGRVIEAGRVVAHSNTPVAGVERIDCDRLV